MGNAHKKSDRKIGGKSKNINQHLKKEKKDLINSNINKNCDKKKELNSLEIIKDYEIIESKEIILDEKHDEIKKTFIFDKENNLYSDSNNHPLRSKSFVNHNNISLYNAPKQKVKLFNENISPFKLCSKTYGSSYWRNKIPNPIIIDFEKTTTDSKSCNDNQNSEDNLDDIELYSDTEVITPNVEDIKNLQNCRKKMAIFRESLDNKSEHSLKENEKIEYIFSEEKSKAIKQIKKKKFWSKHIKQQKLKSKLSRNLSIISDSFPLKSGTVMIKKKDDDLFILGILESASKEIKKKQSPRLTSNI